ncbi:MAG: hypothetical protein ACHQ2Y_04335 [Candidatus Lutacidiplasmatales archaeon]
MTEDAGNPQPGAEPTPTRLYYVPFQALGGVVVRATCDEEAVDLANERFGADELVRADAFQEVVFNHKWGPGVDEEDEDGKTKETTVPPIHLWFVQRVEGGIPQEPVLFESLAEAERSFANVIAADELTYDADESPYYASHDDRTDLRMGEVSVETSEPEWFAEMSTEGRARADSIIAEFARLRNDKQAAEEAVADLNTPGGRCD